MAEDDWASKVARLLLSEFEGRAKFGHLKRSLYQRNLWKGGVTRLLKWLSNTDRFLVFKKDENVKYVSIACQNVSICCGFQNKGCRKERCSKFHVCKFFVSGNCQNGSRCRFGHDLGNEANKRVSDSLGLSSFSSEEIRTIICRSHPAVCVKYNIGGCDDVDCPDLHICSRFILKNCPQETDCELIHSLQMFENNLWVLYTFKLNDLTDVELRKRILVKKHTPRVTEANNGPRSQLTPVSSPNLDQESTSGEEIKENIDDVFRFLFNNFGGRAKFDKFLTGRGHLFQGSDREAIIKWFKNRRNRFALYGNGNDIKYVSVYNKGARVCFKYHDSSSLDCGDEACKYFHICRRFVVGACVSTRCSHSFSSGPNMKVRSDLRLDKLNEGEILSLILCSSPAVCVNHNMSGCCVNDCPDLHVCFKYVFGQCTSGQDCEFGHSVRDSGEHNSYVLKAFQMEKWNEDLLRKLVIVKKGDHRKMPKCARASPEPMSQRVQPRDIPRMSTDNISKRFDLHSVQDADISKYEYICETYTWTGECPNAGNCPRYHSPDRLPYLWMIQRKKDGEWRVVPSSKLLEQSFCDLCDFETLQVRLICIYFLRLNVKLSYLFRQTFRKKDRDI
ncbi:uncharacterized protein LOC112557659 [Pomacea canaliculata]|uniref:uncharacterized protein LOC112557659 n=1 Tax=Pomacea canaliculata TaxID=400727 RepID=UPI000D7359F8|nr:uncharacterized protein LOC112557659 [Pomacea canaliculata]